MTQFGEIWESIPDYLLNNDGWEQLPSELRLEVDRQDFLLAYETELATKASLQLYIQKQEQDHQHTQHFFDNIDWEKFVWLLMQVINSWPTESRIAIIYLGRTCKLFNKYTKLLCRQIPPISTIAKPLIQEDKMNIYCEICKIRIHAHPNNYEQHLRGKKHKNNLWKQQSAL